MRGRISLQSAGGGSGHEEQGTGKGGGGRAVECYGCFALAHQYVRLHGGSRDAEKAEVGRVEGKRPGMVSYHLHSTATVF